MKITELFTPDRVHMSCEIFPPKQFEQMSDAKRVIGEICALRPAYVSVTYGAAGNTPHFTREMSECVASHDVTALSHLTCVNSSIAKVDQVLDELSAAGVENVLALRGDLATDGTFPDGEHYAHASDLIAAIKRRGGFCVGAACYPEGHPEAADRDADMSYLKLKQDMGADFLTTQMFFDNSVLYQFLYRALKKGVTLPVTAGIMPVTRAGQVRRIRSLAGTMLPPRFLAVVDRFGDNPESMQKAGVAYATDQIIDLIANGVSNIHLYTMNNPGVAKAIFDNLGCILDTRYDSREAAL